MLTIGISVLGILTFYGLGPRAGSFVLRHGIFIAIGTLLMLAVSLFDYRILKNYTSASMILYFLAIGFLGLALASREIRGVSSWIVFGGFTFEPAEFAKLALLILFAKYFSQKHVEIYSAKHILASGLYMAIPAAMTLIQPDIGSTLIYVALWLGMLLFAGINRKHLLIIIMAGIVLSSLGWFLVLKDYQKTRIISFMNPYLDPKGSGYNTLQSKISFGSGQLVGITFDKNNNGPAALVPEPYNDFAFSAFARKFGFAGVVTLFILLLGLMFRVGSVALKSQNNFEKLFALGLLTIVFSHVMINAGMNMGMLPITGIPFSFLSYGGSHMLTLMVGLGIIQSIKLKNRN